MSNTTIVTNDMRLYTIDFYLGSGVIVSEKINASSHEQAQIFARQFAQTHHLPFKKINIWEVRNV